MFQKKFVVMPLSVVCTIEQDCPKFDKLSEARYVLRQDVCHLYAALDISEVNLFILDGLFAIKISHI